MVERAIATTPRSFTLFDRDGQPCAELGGDNVHFTPASSGLKILDHRSGETRLATTADFVEYVRLGDGLPHIAYLATAFSTNADIEPGVSDAWRLFLCLPNPRKPVVSGAFTEHGVGRMAEMMQLFRPGPADPLAPALSVFPLTATGLFAPRPIAAPWPPPATPIPPSAWGRFSSHSLRGSEPATIPAPTG